MTWSSTPALRHVAPAPALLRATVVALLLGGLTAFAQSRLPDVLEPLANSAGSWSLGAFVLALGMPPPRRVAVAAGALALAGLVAGYYLTNELRGYPAGSAVRFWLLAAVVVGPALGLAASAVRSGPPLLGALGAGGLAGVLAGEGWYGLTTIADTTPAAYWWGSVVAGLLVLSVVARRLGRPAPVALSVVAAAVVAVGVVAALRGGTI